MPTDREEDSGLHDIKSLASSAKAKARLSGRRSTVNPVMREEDVLASSSAGWKNVALPEPAKMVSLPELSSLPTKAEIEAKDRAAQARKADAPVAATAGAPAVEAPAAASVGTAFGSRIAAQQGSGKGKLFALVGLGVAAAAGAVFVMMSGGGDKAAPTTVAAAEQAPAPAPAAAPAPAPAPAPTPTPTEVAPPTEVAAAAPVAAEPVAEPKADARPAGKAKDDGDKVHRVEVRDTQPAKPAAAKPADKPVEAPKAGGGDGEEPSFDALLKEAGVSDQKTEAKVTLDKKSLSGADIKAGMGGVTGKAQACYAGTQGTATVKATVAPSGQVTKVTVGGPFAGTPVAACVEAAVKSASFPPWDGGPQTISYSYLLAE